MFPKSPSMEEDCGSFILGVRRPTNKGADEGVAPEGHDLTFNKARRPEAEIFTNMNASQNSNQTLRYVTGAVAAALIASIALAKEAAPAAPTSTASQPTITVLAGDHQTGTPGKFNAKPFDLAVWNAAGTEPLVDTEVTFTVQTGGGVLASSKDPVALPSYTLTLKTDEDGTVQAFYQQPVALGILSQIKASAGSAEIVLETTSLAAGDAGSDGSDGTGAGRAAGLAASDRSEAARAVLAGLVASSRQAHANAAARSAPPTARALTLSTTSVKIRTPSQAYAINTASWEITPTTP